MVTELPTPRITPANWGEQLNQGIESRYTENKEAIEAVDDQVDVGLPSGVMEGRTIYQWGPSRGVGVTAKRVHFNRIRERIGSGFWFNGSVGGYLATDAVAYALGNFTASRQGNGINEWAPTVNIGTFANFPNQAAVSLFWPFGNDARLDGRLDRNSTTAKARAGAINAQHAMICLQRSEVRIDSGNINITTTNGSPVVSTALTGWWAYRGMLITGANVPANTYVGEPIAGGLGGFKLSSSRTAQVDVNATGTGTAAHAFTPTTTGVWTATVGSMFSSGLADITVANGATRTWVITLPEARRVWWMTAGFDDAEYVATAGAPYGGTGGGSGTITVDGGTPIVVDNSDQHRFGTKDFTVGPRAIDLGELSAGSHTIVLASTSTDPLVSDCLLIESLTPLTMVLVKEPIFAPETYALYASTGFTQAKTELYNSFMDDELTLWPDDESVLLLDPMDMGFDPALHISWADGAGIHLNDAGERLVADGIMERLNQLSGRPGLVWV